MITIHTTRYSAVIVAFLQQFPDAMAMLDKREQVGAPTVWCTNAHLLNAINFSLRRGNIELLGFHDGPHNMWASAEALNLVQSLAEQRILRFTEAPPRKPSLLARLLGCRNAA